VRVTLTEKGEELIREMDSAVPDIINYVFGSLSNEELEIFEPLMRKIRDAAARWVGARPEHLDVTIERLVPRV
jgi:DNA-binding MarR family transcriptional regulator